MLGDGGNVLIELLTWVLWWTVKWIRVKHTGDSTSHLFDQTSQNSGSPFLSPGRYYPQTSAIL